MKDTLQYWVDHISASLPEFRWEKIGPDMCCFKDTKLIGGYSLSMLTETLALGEEAVQKFADKVINTFNGSAGRPQDRTGDLDRIFDVLPKLWEAGFRTKPQDGKWWLFDKTGDGICGGDDFRCLCAAILHWHDIIAASFRVVSEAKADESK